MPALYHPHRTRNLKIPCQHINLLLRVNAAFDVVLVAERILRAIRLENTTTGTAMLKIFFEGVSSNRRNKNTSENNDHIGQHGQCPYQQKETDTDANQS